MQKRISLICFAAVMLTFGVCNNVNAQVFTYVFGLSGAQEVPIGSGDPDGFGTATLMIDSATNTVDWDFVVSGIDLPLTGAHIHQAPAGTNGGIIVNFGGALTGSGLLTQILRRWSPTQRITTSTCTTRLSPVVRFAGK